MCLTWISPVVRRLLSRAARSTLFSSMNVRSSLAVVDPLSISLRRSASAPASEVENSARFFEKVRIADAESSCPVSTVLLSRISAVVIVEVLVGGLDEGVRGVDDLAEVRAGAVEGQAELGDHRLQRATVDVADGVGDVGEQLDGRDRQPGVVHRDLGLVLEVGPPSLDGCSSTYCSPIAERLPTRAIVSLGILSHLLSMLEVGVDALLGQLQVGDLADGDAAVGHLGAVERAARVREVRDHRVGVVEEHPVEPRVAGTDVGDPDQGDDHEEHQLDVGATGDHFATPGRSTWTSTGS